MQSAVAEIGPTLSFQEKLIWYSEWTDFYGFHNYTIF